MRESIWTGKAYEKNVPFSLGVVSEGRLLHTSGITSCDSDGKLVGAGDMGAQIGQAFQNLADIFDHVRASFSDVVKFTIYTTDIDLFNDKATAVASRYFKHRPASTLVEVSRLMYPKILVEIEAIVLLPDVKS